MTQKQEKRLENVTNLRYIMTTTRFLRGHLNENDNFRLFLELAAKYVCDLHSCLRSRRRRKYLSYKNQNEILQMLADHVVRDLVYHLPEVSTMHLAKSRTAQV